MCFQNFDLEMKLSEMLRDGSPPFVGAHLFQIQNYLPSFSMSHIYIFGVSLRSLRVQRVFHCDCFVVAGGRREHAFFFAIFNRLMNGLSRLLHGVNRLLILWFS